MCTPENEQDNTDSQQQLKVINLIQQLKVQTL